MKTVKTLLIMLLVSTATWAQSNLGEIHGKLLDIDTKEPMAYSQVFVEFGSSKIGATTDGEGQFIIKPLQPGTYTLYYQMLSGEKQPVIKDVLVKPDKIARADEVFASASDVLPDVIVPYYGKLIDPEDPSAVTLTAKDIKVNANLRNPVQMLATMDSGIKVDFDGTVSMRGAREGNVVYIVDGIKTTNMNLPGAAYESITTYTGGLPAKYGDTTGGVIVVESKSYFDYYRAWKAQQEANN